jgi:membrane peptidoglycan carboxypeptidase
MHLLSRKHLRAARAADHRARRNVWIAIGTTLLVLLLLFLSLGTAGSVIAYRFYTQTQNKYEHSVATLRDLLPLDNLKMYDSKGVPLMQMTDQGIHTTVTFDEVAPYLLNATIATEDKNFWTNQGIDILRILRAAIDDLRSGQVVEGGSTITQQLIKNLIVGNQATFIRKLEEIVLTPQINSLYTKRDILEMYLNSIYYGHQAYGVDAAATVYFGLEDKPGQRASMQLDLAQAAMIAGIPSNPSAYDPLLHPQAAFGRFQSVLGLMVTQQYITKVDALEAMKEAQSPNFFKAAPSLTDRAPHFANFVLDQLVQLFKLKDRSQLSRSGMIVYTTLDIKLQDKIQKIAQKHIAELRAAHNLTNAAEVLIDYHTGAIISLLGSIDYNNTAIDGQFDVATQGYRQPGSSFKPYVYVTAFKQGASPAQAINDAPTTIANPGGDPPLYSPTNYDLSFHGHMTLRCALQNSLNVPAVRVLKRVGIAAAMETAKEMGITSYEGTPGYSLVLGGLGIRLIDHTSAMGAFANGGVRVNYYAINKVVSGATHKVIYNRQPDPGQRVISPQLAYMMTSVLSDNTARIPEFFDCNVLQLYSNSQTSCYNGNRGIVRPAAAKTGTTQNFRDNWTVGYTTDYVMGVWAGNDNNSPMYNVTGVQGAAPIWHDSMLVAEQGRPVRDFTNPGGLQQATVTYPDGVKTTDWFIPGTVPTSANPTPVPSASPDQGTPTSTPQPGGDTPATTSARPYCPSVFGFAFNPPPPDQAGDGWW